MKELRIKVKGIDTIGNCIQVDTSSTYSSNVTKDQLYINSTNMAIKVTNICNVPFTLAEKVVIKQVDNYGSTFEATMPTIVIPANTTVYVPVTYNGTYKGTDLAPIYTFTVNNIVVTYKLNVTIPVAPDVIGTISNFSINRANKENYTFKVADFTSHYNDPDGDTIAFVMFSGDTSTIKYNGVPYIADTQVALADVIKFEFIAPIETTQVITTLTYKVKDNKGNIIA